MSGTEPAPSPPRRFRWLQFSLRTLLVVILVAGLGLAWYSRELRRRERIEKAVRLLALCPTPYDGDFNPVTVVRAVNCLRAMGKKEAIEALRTFNGQSSVDGTSIRGGEPDALRIVVPLLFDPVDSKAKFPSWSISRRNVDSHVRFADFNFHLFVADELPFGILMNGLFVHSQDESSLIDWAQRQGRLRESPLHPGDEPLQLADTVISQWSDGNLGVERSLASNVFSIDDIRQQALRCVSHLDGTKRDHPNVVIQDDEWARLKADCRRLGIRWSEEKQEYVATKSAK